jgi:antirestriction protein ArdC
MNKKLKIRKKDVYQLVTDRIIKQLEAGTVPWKMQWQSRRAPVNLVTRKQYRGINHLLLSSLNYEQNYFLSMKQVNDLGGKVKKGESANMVVFWKILELSTSKSNNEEKTSKVPFLRYYNVFNIAQCEGLPEKLLPQKVQPGINDPIESCREIVFNMPKCPQIKHSDEGEAYYHTVKDFVNMPKMELFTSSHAYYSTLFHELVHSTGHESRLARHGIIKHTHFGSDTYSFEELVAEIGACFLNAQAEIETQQFDNNVAYINGWLKRLRQESRLVVKAGMEAQKAVDFILDVKYQESTQNSHSQTPIKDFKEALSP